MERAMECDNMSQEGARLMEFQWKVGNSDIVVETFISLHYLVEFMND